MVRFPPPTRNQQCPRVRCELNLHFDVSGPPLTDAPDVDLGSRRVVRGPTTRDSDLPLVDLGKGRRKRSLGRLEVLLDTVGTEFYLVSSYSCQGRLLTRSVFFFFYFILFRFCFLLGPSDISVTLSFSSPTRCPKSRRRSRLYLANEGPTDHGSFVKFFTLTK